MVKKFILRSFKIVINKICLDIIYFISMYTSNLALNNQQRLICHKIKPKLKISWIRPQGFICLYKSLFSSHGAYTVVIRDILFKHKLLCRYIRWHLHPETLVSFPAHHIAQVLLDVLADICYQQKWWLVDWLVGWLVGFYDKSTFVTPNPFLYQ